MGTIQWITMASTNQRNECAIMDLKEVETISWNGD